MKTIIISILVTLYHFIYRIIVGEVTSKIDTNKPINCNSILLHEFKFEKPLYDFLKVKKWKGLSNNEILKKIITRKNSILQQRN